MDKLKKYGQGTFLEYLCQALDLKVRPKLIRYYTNLIYDCGDFIVRLTPNAVRTKEEVRRELHWMKFVGTHTKDVVQVLSGAQANAHQIECDGEHFTITVLEKIEGEPIKEVQWNSTHFERLGNLTGFLHRIGQEYRAPEDADLSEWDEIPEACLAHDLPMDERNLPQLNKEVFDHMVAMPRFAQSYGPIHYDIHPGNYLMTADGRMVLFDFENSCRGHYINDIAVVLYYSKFNKFSNGIEGFSHLFLASFWNGYEHEYSVPQHEIQHIPWLQLNRSLIVYGYLLKIWPAERDAVQSAYVEEVERSIVSVRNEVGL